MAPGSDFRAAVGPFLTAEYNEGCFERVCSIALPPEWTAPIGANHDEGQLLPERAVH